MAWATTDDVLDITGSAVTTGELAQADAVVTVYCGRTPDAVDRISERDLYWLKLATAFQAAWQAEQVSYETRSSVASVDQDEMNVEFSSEWQVVLAPNAARALKNLSWKRNRRVGARPRYAYRNFTLESSDYFERWFA